MRIAIDAHCIGQNKTGNETYTVNLVRHLSALEDDTNEYFIYLTREGQSAAKFTSNSHCRTRRIWPSSPYFRIPIGFSIQTRLEKFDVFHAQYFLPLNLPCKTVLTVHDVLYERFPEFYTKAARFRNRLGIPSSCRRADRIITVSESSKRDLVEIYGLNPERISVTYPGPAESFLPLDKESSRERLRSAYGIDGPFVLYVGNLQPRKNLARLLNAFAYLKEKECIPHKLVIVGPKAWLYGDVFNTLERSSLRSDVLLTGYVPNEDLPFLYNTASLFVYPSICEGFGLPVIEAMACGTPTVASRGSSLEEIAKDAAVLVDPLDVSSIAAAIEKVAMDPCLQADLSQRGLARSRDFSCRKMAEQTRSIYERVAG